MFVLSSRFFISTCLLTKFLVITTITMSELAQATSTRKWASIKYSTVTGFFAQDLPDTDDETFDFIASNFGLLDKFQLEGLHVDAENLVPSSKSPPWKKFKSVIKSLNKNAPKNTQYKVFFIARHGQGFHNVAESFYGTHLWDCYWSLLDGNGTSRWDDAELTPLGISEVARANVAWKQQLEYGAPLPEIWFTSPLRRAAHTLEITWGDITLNSDDIPKPIIKEKLRETMGIHTCDRRSSRCEIARAFPTFTFEHGFPEGPDPFWDPINREPDAAKTQRLKTAIDEILEFDSSQTYISLTGHSAAIQSLLKAFGHRPFRLQTSGMIPVAVKVEYSAEKEPPTSSGSGGVAPKCTVDPTAPAI
ncbi:phosphoglycerate mutase [Peziza echinospora]|nr:phosphoglycerate mutase [Peziza echinospora]